jgi:hypothetical protein
LRRYLASDEVSVPFIDVANRAGNTPLSHAVAYGREEVVQWLLELEERGRWEDVCKIPGPRQGICGMVVPSCIKIFDMVA